MSSRWRALVIFALCMGVVACQPKRSEAPDALPQAAHTTLSKLVHELKLIIIFF